MPQFTYVKDNETTDYTPSSDVTGGDLVVQDTLVGVANHDISDSALGTLVLHGLYDGVKVTGAIAVGAALYWDDDGDPLGGTAGTGACTTTATANTFIGTVVLAAAETDTTVRLVLQNTVTVNAGLRNVITDPGAAGAIPVTRSGSCSLVSAAAETRTLAIPAFFGQEISLGFKTDVDDITLTVASAINQTGNNTLVFADAGDQIGLIGIELGANLVWRVAGIDGVALSTV